ncbi:MAG: elongation factor P, partial [Pseudomonadota bacterium]
DEGAKGNTASGATKTVVLETGAVVTVPLFIKTGDLVGIDPETGAYLERG